MLRQVLSYDLFTTYLAALMKELTIQMVLFEVLEHHFYLAKITVNIPVGAFQHGMLHQNLALYHLVASAIYLPF